MEIKLAIWIIIINKTQLVMIISQNLTFIMKPWLGTLLVFKDLKFKPCIKVQILNRTLNILQQDKFIISHKIQL